MKQHKLNHIVGGVNVGHIRRRAVVNRDHHVLESDETQHDVQEA